MGWRRLARGFAAWWRSRDSVGAGGAVPTWPAAWGGVADDEACRLILDRAAPEGMFATDLEFRNEPRLTSLPAKLRASSLVIERCPNLVELPPGVWVAALLIQSCDSFAHVPGDAFLGRVELVGCGELRALPPGLDLRLLRVSGCPALTTLPLRLSCDELIMPESALAEVPRGVTVHSRLDLSGSRRLERLRPPLTAHEVILRGCSALRELPGCIAVERLDLSGCTSLCWQGYADARVGHLDLSGCGQISCIPDWLAADSVDVADSGIDAPPPHHPGLGFAWRGVRVSPQVAFAPGTITARAVFEEPNAELRRTMIERMGPDRFLAEADPEVLDRDLDTGGERRLLRVRFADPSDEDLVMVTLVCPSTGRRYVVRVPPRTATCRQAVAWMAGFDRPDEYEPVVET